MKNLAINSKVLVLFSAFFIFLSGQALAVSVSIYSVSSEQAAINNWIASLGTTTIIEDFEGITPGWYQNLSTDIGEFHITQDTLAGTGGTSYENKTGNEGTYFEVRDYNADGRKNFTNGGANYIDTADITELSLEVDGEYTNLFFYMSDPSDVRAMTTTSTVTTVGPGAGNINYKQSNGSLWFVGINTEVDDEYISTITWNASVNGQAFTDDGFGLDDFGTVPEPSTALLLGAGLLPLVGFLRRKKKEQM